MNNYEARIIRSSQMANGAVVRDIAWGSLGLGIETGPGVLFFLF